MKVHLSIDDVILSLKELYETEPKSVFDITFFRDLKTYHEKYGAKFSLYSFVKYKDFLISQIPSIYWNELIDCSEWLRFGFHGTHTKENVERFSYFCDLFYSVVPKQIQTSTLRLHRYFSTDEELRLLKAMGLTELLCRDNESSRRLGAAPSYDLSQEEYQLLAKKSIRKNEIIYKKTNVQIELFDQQAIEFFLREEIKKSNEEDVFVIFTHEVQLFEKKYLIDKVIAILQKNKVEFIF